MVGVLGPNPSVDTRKEAIPQDCLYYFATEEHGKTRKKYKDIVESFVAGDDKFSVLPCSSVAKIDPWLKTL